MQLTDVEKRILDGEQGEAKKIALEILVQMGDALGAESFVPVASVQAMAHFGSLHIAGRDWLEKLACLGGQVLCADHPGPGRPFPSNTGRRWATTRNTRRTSCACGTPF